MKPNKVLVIDDEVFIRDLLNDFLTHANIPCCTASGADEACRLLAEEPFQVALVDQFLGDESFEEVARRIRERRPGLPIVMLSGALAVNPDRLNDLGIVDFIAKPFTLDTLLTVLKPYMETE